MLCHTAERTALRRPRLAALRAAPEVIRCYFQFPKRATVCRKSHSPARRPRLRSRGHFGTRTKAEGSLPSAFAAVEPQGQHLSARRLRVISVAPPGREAREDGLGPAGINLRETLVAPMIHRRVCADSLDENIRPMVGDRTRPSAGNTESMVCRDGAIDRPRGVRAGFLHRRITPPNASSA